MNATKTTGTSCDIQHNALTFLVNFVVYQCKVP